MTSHSPLRTNGALACAGRIEAILKSFPRIKHDDPTLWAARLSELQVLILNEGGSYKDDWQGAQVRLWGFKATSTMGLTGACRNWITQVTLKSDAAAMDRVKTTRAAQALS